MYVWCKQKFYFPPQTWLLCAFLRRYHTLVLCLGKEEKKQGNKEEKENMEHNIRENKENKREEEEGGGDDDDDDDELPSSLKYFIKQTNQTASFPSANPFFFLSFIHSFIHSCIFYPTASLPSVPLPPIFSVFFFLSSFSSCVRRGGGRGGIHYNFRDFSKYVVRITYV